MAMSKKAAMQNNLFIFTLLPILLFLTGFQQSRLLLVDLVLGLLLAGLNRLQHLLGLLRGNLRFTLPLSLLRLGLIALILILVLIVIPIRILILILILVVIVLVPIVVLILILILILILVLILILILVLLLILIPVVASAATLLLLVFQHLLCVGVVLLGVKVARIAEQRLLVGIHSGLPILFLHGDVAQIVIIVSGIGRHWSDILQSLHRLSGLLEVALTIERSGKIVAGRERRGVLNHSLAVLYPGVLPIAFLELAVAGTDLLSVSLRQSH